LYTVHAIAALNDHDWRATSVTARHGVDSSWRGASALTRDCEERSDEAIQPSGRWPVLDCFAALALTLVGASVATAVRGSMVAKMIAREP
jgi:hypothetical protein